MKRPKKKTGGNADAAQGSNNRSLRDQASPANATGVHATKSEKIRATLKAKGTIDDVRRCYRGFCEAVLNALPEGSAQ